MQIACRCEEPLLTATMQKVSMFCHVTPQQVMGVHNVSSTYHVPLLMKDQGLIDFLAKKLDLASVKITKELKQSGDNLSMRWKALTSGYVKSKEIEYGAWLTKQSRATLRHCLHCSRWQIHLATRFLHECGQGS
jgi:CTP synthase (UTP-ammonia lyase)